MKNQLMLLLCVCLSIALNAQEVLTIAGTGAIGETNGPAAEANFNNPHGIATDDQGTVYVADRYGHTIRKISPDGIVTTLAGSGNTGSEDGTGTAASFNEPWGLCVGSDGNIYVADTKNNLIRKVTPQGEVTTYAGNGNYGITDGPAAAASFGTPTGIDMDSDGNLYIADHLTHIIRKITPDGFVSRVAGAPYCFGLVDGNSDQALLNRPYGLTVDLAGNIIVADEWNHAIRLITPSGDVTTIAGNGTIGHDDGSDSFATFHYPWDVAVDNSGNIFVADGYNHSIRKLIPSGAAPLSYGVLTFAGVSGETGWLDGYGTEAQFNGAAGIHYCKQSDEVYVADTYNNKIRKVIDHNEQSVLLQIINNEQGVICDNDGCKAIAFPANFDTYIFFLDGQIVQSGSNPEYTTNTLSAGTHTISCHGINPAGSFISNEFSITVLDAPLPVIEVDGVLPMPQESSVVLTTDEGVSCTWSTGDTEPVIVIDEPNVITVDVLFPNGCIGTSEPINIQQYCSIETPIIEFVSNNGSSDCFFNAVPMQTDFADGDIQWLLNGQPISGAEGNTYEATQTGAYQIIVTTFQQQVYSNVLQVQISAPLIEDFEADKILIFEDDPVVKFKPDFNGDYGDYSYEWNFGDFDSGDDNYSNKKKPKHKFSGVGVYSISLKVTDNNTGCSQTIYKPDMIIYAVGFDEEGDDGNNIIYVPTAFTPNGDGENDVLYVRGEEVASLEFNIYNRRGKLVFKSKNQSVGWDGFIQGLPCANETYNYVVKAKMNNGDEENRSGKVFVIR